MSKPIKIIVISAVAVVVTLAVVLGCVFGIKCTVTFYSGISSNLSSHYNTNSSSGSGRIILSLYPPQTKVTRCSTFSPFIPSADGYTFLGWYKDSALTVPWLSTDKVTSNITLYAKWEAE